MSLKGDLGNTDTLLQLAAFVACMVILLFNFEIPWPILEFYDSGLGKLSIFSVVVYLFYSRRFMLGILLMLFVMKLNILYDSYIPNECRKRALMATYNNNLYQISLEEEIIQNSASVVNAHKSTMPPLISMSSYLPIMSDAHGAMGIR
jgi:hypothetical protein